MADRLGLCDYFKRRWSRKPNSFKGEFESLLPFITWILQVNWHSSWPIPDQFNGGHIRKLMPLHCQHRWCNLYSSLVHSSVSSYICNLQAKTLLLGAESHQFMTKLGKEGQYICFGRWQTDSTTRRFLCQRRSEPKEAKMQLSSLVLVSTHSLTGACSEYLSLPHATQSNQGNCQ